MRIVRFLKVIWSDLNITPKEMGSVLLFSIVASGAMFLVLTAIVYPLCWLTDKPVTNEAYRASIGLLMFLLCIICAVNYLMKKWKEAKVGVYEETKSNRPDPPNSIPKGVVKPRREDKKTKK